MENTSFSKKGRKWDIKLVKFMSIPDNNNNCTMDFKMICEHIGKGIIIT